MLTGPEVFFLSLFVGCESSGTQAFFLSFFLSKGGKTPTESLIGLKRLYCTIARLLGH